MRVCCQVFVFYRHVSAGEKMDALDFHFGRCNNSCVGLYLSLLFVALFVSLSLSLCLCLCLSLPPSLSVYISPRALSFEHYSMQLLTHDQNTFDFVLNMVRCLEFLAGVKASENALPDVFRSATTTD